MGFINQLITGGHHPGVVINHYEFHDPTGRWAALGLPWRTWWLCVLPPKPCSATGIPLLKRASAKNSLILSTWGWVCVYTIYTYILYIIYIYTYDIYVYIYIWHTHIHIYIYICNELVHIMHACMHAYMYYIYTHTRIHTYTHTHTHTHKYTYT